MKPGSVTKNYSINVVVNIKRGKEEMEFARIESDRLHNLLGSGQEAAWAKQQIERIHELIFLPPADRVKTALLKELDKETDEAV